MCGQVEQFLKFRNQEVQQQDIQLYDELFLKIENTFPQAQRQEVAHYLAH